jgi:flagellar hook-associated protein 2
MVEEDRLKESIVRSPEAVKELFVSDQNADNQNDNGVAFKMAETIKPYTRSSGGLISVRIDLIKTKITDNKVKMDRMQLGLKSKEERLRQKYGAMESAINRSKETGKYLKNNLPSGND